MERRRPVRKEDIFLTEIECVAAYKAESLNPFVLEKMGRHEEAQMLSFAIGVLEENNLMGRAEKRAEELRRLEVPPEESAEKKWQQTSFLNPEKKIEQLHNRYKRTAIIRKDVDYQRKRRLRNLGVSAAKKREKLYPKIDKAIARLQLLGLWGFISKPGRLTYKEIEFIRKIIREYREPIRDLDSSEGFTIYPNLASWFVDIYGGESYIESLQKDEVDQS